MTRIDDLKKLILDNYDDPINPNVVFPKIDNLVAETINSVTADVDSYKTVANTVSDPASGSSVLIGSTVELSTTTEGAIIYYTLDESDPDETDLVYSEPIVITGPTTIKSVGYKGYQNPSAIQTHTFTIAEAATPVASPAAGAVIDTTEVTLTSTTAGATIYYTVDGSEPDETGIEYTAPIALTLPETIKAIAIATDMVDSSVATFAYTKLQVSTPIPSIEAGEVLIGDEIEISCATPGATIYYTVNGDDPETLGSEYTAAITVSTGFTLKAVAVLANATTSEILTAEYTISE
ncbi:MAG: chitobiase/beta-hexosaminidase C-terminal domain-containing protein [Bacteroidia bacterium]|nr:chitobiase/beta-hexosaminidase C-terminal domain-containing protein [Bacteroidia bacterium]